MSPLLPNQGPPLKLTHDPIPPEEMMRLRDALRTRCQDSKVTMDVIEQVASSSNAPRAHVYASAALDPNLVIDAETNVLIAICVGTCQGQGAIENLETLLKIRSERKQAGKRIFDVVPRTCLDMCVHSPIAMSRSPHGMAAHPKLTKEQIDELVTTLCD